MASVFVLYFASESRVMDFCWIGSKLYDKLTKSIVPHLSGFSLLFQKLGFSLAKRENPASPAGAQEEENQGSLLPIQHSENQRTVNCPKDKRESSRGYLCRATRWSGGTRETNGLPCDYTSANGKKQPQTPCGCFDSITRSRAPPAPWRCHAGSVSTRPCRPERRSRSEHR